MKAQGCCQTRRTEGDTLYNHQNNTQLMHYFVETRKAWNTTTRRREYNNARKRVYENSEFNKQENEPNPAFFAFFLCLLFVLSEWFILCHGSSCILSSNVQHVTVEIQFLCFHIFNSEIDYICFLSLLFVFTKRLIFSAFFDTFPAAVFRLNRIYQEDDKKMRQDVDLPKGERTTPFFNSEILVLVLKIT